VLIARLAGCGALLAGPAVLAFFSGGYFQTPREWAGLIAWAVAALALIATRNRPPVLRPTRAAVIALALFAAWTLASIAWAPIAGRAYHAGQLAFVYLGAVFAAAIIFREPPMRRGAEPALAAGALIVIAYGLSGRLLPGLIHLAHSVSAEGRLEQPLTYWNAIGELAALGFVLCARLAGDSTRPLPLRSAAVAAAVPLGMGLYTSLSRGALFACAAGLIALVALVFTREQVRALLLVVGAGAAAALACAPFHGFTSLAGSQAARERQGAIVLGLVVSIALLAMLAHRRLERSRATGGMVLPRRAPAYAVVLICAGLGLAIALGAKEPTNRPIRTGAARYVSLQSDRYAYWGVALKAFASRPVIGVGAGAWSVWWLMHRPFAEPAQDAHSLPLQTLAELGIVGLGLLLAFFGAMAFSALAAHRVAPAAAAGPIAGTVAWLAHAPLDWDWQMPAVTLVAMILAGVVIAAAERPTEPLVSAAEPHDEEI